MTKKKQAELEAMSPEETTVLIAAEEEVVPTAAEQVEDTPAEPSEISPAGDDLNALLAAMDGDPETAPPYSDEQDESDAGEEQPAFDSEETAEPLAEEPSHTEDTAPSDPAPPKPKRVTRKKAAVSDVPVENPPEPADDATPATPPTVEVAAPAKRFAKRKAAPILTIEAHAEAQTQESIEDTIWHEIHNAYRTRRILTGTMGGIEQTDNGKTIVIVEYKGFRIIIPIKEMMINLGRSPSGAEYDDLMRSQNKILGNMLGAEIDFMVKGIDSKTRSVVASRQEAMFKKRQLFYLNTDAAGMYRIYEGRVVQARVIAVAEKVVRVEVFGVECSILARDLAWDWIGDAHERFSVGDQILVRILSVKRESLEDISITADAKSVSEDQTHENLKKCRVQSKYSGKVTDVRRGVVYIRLTNGVNGVAHSCYDRRMPGKKDDVSFAVTRIDEERGVAVGIITRIIKQHL